MGEPTPVAEYLRYRGTARPVCEDGRFAIESSIVRIAARRLSRHASDLAEEIVSASVRQLPVRPE